MFFGKIKQITFIILNFGVIVGLLYGLRPAAVTFVPCTLVTFTLKLKKIKGMLVFIYFISALSTMLISENLLHKAYHKEKSSILPELLCINTLNKENFSFPQNLEKHQEDLLKKIDYFEPYQDWKTENNNKFVIRIFDSQFEALAQMELMGNLSKKYEGMQTLSRNDLSSLGLETIYENISGI